MTSLLGAVGGRLGISFRSWYLYNLDTNELFQSQFEAEELTRDININYAEHTALNRANPIIQFLNKEAETCTFQATLFRQSVAENTVEDDLALLQSWAEPDPTLNRPPLMSFSVGDGFYNLDCVITGITGITYDRPTFGGGVRKVTFTVNLKQYQEFALDSGGIFETRYHYTKDRDYYELVAQREYGDALKGDIIRKRNPTMPNMQVGDRIPFPAIEAIRSDRVTQTSIALKGAYDKRLTATKANRLDMLERRNRPYVSHTILE